MREAPNKKLVFIIDELGRTLIKESLHKLIAELFDKALDERNIDALVVNSQSINICAYLLKQIIGRDIAEWELIYFHGSIYPPVLLNGENKEKLVALLPDFEGTSATAVYKVLTDAGAFEHFH